MTRLGSGDGKMRTSLPKFGFGVSFSSTHRHLPTWGLWYSGPMRIPSLKNVSVFDRHLRNPMLPAATSGMSEVSQAQIHSVISASLSVREKAASVMAHLASMQFGIFCQPVISLSHNK